MICKEWLHRTYLIFAMLAIAICGCFSMEMNDGEDSGHVALIYLTTFTILLPGLIFYFKTRFTRRPPKPIAWFVILFTWLFLITFILGLSSIRATAFFLLRLLIALCALCMSYDYAGRYGLTKKIHWASVSMLILLLFQYILIFLSANLLDTAHLITAYYPLFLLPLVMMHPSRWIRYASVLLVIVAVFTSVKRGGLVALVLCLIVYIICKQKIQSRGIKTFLSSLTALSVLFIVFIYIANSEYGEVIERLMSISDDGGSGRTDVWATTWDMISESNIVHLLIGHGSNSVMADSPLELSAHNDFLEAWYDYGFIGFMLYTISLLSLFAYTMKCVKQHSEIAPSLAMLCTIMIILSMISHVLIYYFMTLCCLTIGLLIGQQRFYEHNK